MITKHLRACSSAVTVPSAHAGAARPAGPRGILLLDIFRGRHRHVGQRPIVAAGNTDGDLPMLQWAAASPGRTLQIVIEHTDKEREYAYDRDPVLDVSTERLLAAAEQGWTVVDMAADGATVHAPVP
jgi:hypothetical protein